MNQCSRLESVCSLEPSGCCGQGHGNLLTGQKENALVLLSDTAKTMLSVVHIN